MRSFAEFIRSYLLRVSVAAIFLLVAGSAQAITFDEARHLLSRTGFGTPDPWTVRLLMSLDYEVAVDRLLDGVRKSPVIEPPAFQSHPRDQYIRKDRSAFLDYSRRIKADQDALKKWWIEEMVATDSPLTERMVLFWHNHFVSESAKVKFGPEVFGQNNLFRRHAVGNFADLLHQVSVGYAMMVYLGGEKNHKDGPNENFARELLELFTMGEGKGYTERDIREAARSFTGWWIDRETGQPVFRPSRHDPGAKTFMGRHGHFTGADIVNIVLRQPVVSRFVVRKLWREFVSPSPDPDEVERIAQIFESSRFEMRPLLKALLMSPKFRDPKWRQHLIKSPIDLVIGSLRGFRFSDLNIDQVYFRPALLGQNLFDPPNVSGWPGGHAWISSTTTLARDLFLRSLLISSTVAAKGQGDLGEKKGPFGDANPWPLLRAEHRFPGILARSLLVRTSANRRPDDSVALSRLHDLILDPLYQLK